MLILDGTVGADVSAFLNRIYEDTPPCKIMMYSDWLITHSSHAHCNGHDEHPKGMIYIRVMPEIALKRIQKRSLPATSEITLEYIQYVYKQKEELLIEGKNLPTELQNIPVLVLNGNIDFQIDFSQFYSHLFYIKRFLNQIQEREDIALGVYKEKPHRRCC